MEFWKTMTYRWDGESLGKWSSFRRTAYMLFFLLIYFIIHDVTEILMWAGLDVMMQSQNQSLVQFLTNHTATVRGVINGSSILLGTAIIWPAIRNEICYKQTGSERIENRKNVREHKGDETKEGEVLSEKVTCYGLVAGIAFCAAVGLNILFFQLGITSSSQSFEAINEMQYGVQFAVGLILYGIISPFTEEAVFRGLLYNRMKRCFSVGIAMVFSALLFGCYHGNFVQALYGTILGILIAYLYEKIGGFEIPVLFHSIANVSVYVMTYQGKLSRISAAFAWLLATGALLMGGILLGYAVTKSNRENK